MKDLKIKICGMTEPANIRLVSGLGPDYMGFIFFQKSPRYFGESNLEPIEGIKKTGVFVNASLSYIIEKVTRLDLDAIQLHGEETPDFCRSLRRDLNINGGNTEIIKAFGIQNREDLEAVRTYEGLVDFALFDTRSESRGGSGKSFDWSILRDYEGPLPFILSGGINPSSTTSIRELYQYFRQGARPTLFYGIDVNSRFEQAPGVKDPVSLQEFIKQIKKQE